MVGKNGRQPAVVKPFAYYLRARLKEKLLPFWTDENCSLGGNT